MATAVLVTGGCGFIGTWVVRELLQRDARIFVLDAQPAPERWDRVLGRRATEIVCTHVALTDRDAIQSVIERHAVSHVNCRADSSSRVVTSGRLISPPTCRRSCRSLRRAMSRATTGWCI